jgi:hypothetical protein
VNPCALVSSLQGLLGGIYDLSLTVWFLVFFWGGQVAPQNDRVLVRLEQIPEVSPLSIVSPLQYAWIETDTSVAV